MGVEIERKFLVKEFPDDLNKYPFHQIEQAYLNVSPAVRVRREDDTYYMTYKGLKGSATQAGVNSAIAAAPEGKMTTADGSNVTKPSGQYTEPGSNQQSQALGQTAQAQSPASTWQTAQPHIGQTEYNMPLTKEAYEHLSSKADGNIITKKRYLIPLNDDAFDEDILEANPELRSAVQNRSIKIELDVFEGVFAGRILAEVEFPSEEAALVYHPAEWFSQDVTGDPQYSNAHMSAEQL